MALDYLYKNRGYQLIVGDFKNDPNNALDITENHITFDITKTSDNKKKNDSASIEIYNLSDQQLAVLDTEYIAASFSAGYYNTSIKRLFAGQVNRVTTRKQNTEIVTQIVMGSAYTDLNHQMLSQLVAPGRSYKDVYEEIRKSLPNVVRGVYAGTNIKSQVINGYPLQGTPKQILSQLSEATQTEYRIDGDVLYVNDKAGTISENYGQAFVISPESGLIELAYKTGGDITRSKKDPVKKRGIQFKCFLTAEIIPGQIIKLEQGDTLDGWYKVDEVRFSGDFRGQPWYVEVNCSEKIKV